MGKYLDSRGLNTLWNKLKESFIFKSNIAGLVKNDGTIDTNTYLVSNSTYWANTSVSTTANYITEPEVKSIKINGSSTNTASSTNVLLQYDDTNKCLNFIIT